MQNRIQNLGSFKLPPGFRGRPGWYVQLWWFVQATFFRLSPQVFYGYRAWILRLFGAKIGKKTIIRPSAQFTYPWKISIGDHVWIGDDVVLYSLGDIHIGNDSVISQRSYICAGDHDYSSEDFPIRGRRINIGAECWIAADTFVAPGVSIGDGCVVGARSSVFSDLPKLSVAVGNPARRVKSRQQSVKDQA
ncbi:putative colanic acid biosynthesis acetyltransferase [Aquabacterium sp.]|uniref:putative colanic acid biosynthesis acetyltransferase n=1 Tax=Aquabacterium sp. TaxID=1872578 RepID=UPI0035AE07C4